MKTLFFLTYWLLLPSLVVAYILMLRHQKYSWPVRLVTAFLASMLTATFYVYACRYNVDNLPQFILADAYPIYTFPSGVLLLYITRFLPIWLDKELGSTTFVMTLTIALSILINTFFLLMILEKIFGAKRRHSSS